MRVGNTHYHMTKHAKKRFDERIAQRSFPVREALEFIVGWQNDLKCVWRENGNRRTLVTIIGWKDRRVLGCQTGVTT